MAVCEDRSCARLAIGDHCIVRKDGPLAAIVTIREPVHVLALMCSTDRYNRIAII